MSILQEIAERRSIRRYQDRDVDDALIREILEAGRLAPSGSNTQPWRFLVVRDPALKQAIAAVDHAQDWMLSAPVFLVCLADIGSRADEPDAYDLDEQSADNDVKLIIRDNAIAVGYMLLQAQHLGLGTCWTGWYDQRAMREALGLPGRYYVSGVVTLGYADQAPKPRPRIPLDELILNER